MWVEHATARRPQCGASATAEGGRGARVARGSRVARAGASLGGRRPQCAARSSGCAAEIVGRAIDARSTSTPASVAGEVDELLAAVAAAAGERDRRGAAHQPRARAAGASGGRRAWRRWRAATPTSSIGSTSGGAARVTSTSRELLAKLTGAEDALVVNNCAAAVLLALSQLAAGRGVDRVARRAGRDRRLVPRARRDARLGGAARRGRHDQPHARARLRARAIGADDGAAAQGAPLELRHRRLHRRGRARASWPRSAHARGLVDDGRPRLGRARRSARARRLGAARADGAGAGGAAAPTSSPSAATSCSAGRRPASSSARSALIAAMRAHPLLRALRPDKLTLAALEATLELYRDGRSSEIPTMAMLADARADARGARAYAGRRLRARRRRRSTSCRCACARPSVAARCRGRAVVVGGRRERARRRPARRPMRSMRACARGHAARGRRASPTIACCST